MNKRDLFLLFSYLLCNNMLYEIRITWVYCQSVFPVDFGLKSTILRRGSQLRVSTRTIACPEPWPTGLPLDVLTEEVPHQVGNLVAVLLQREVSGVEQVKLQVL